jgi:molybdate transport system ATP-binding protein
VHFVCLGLKAMIEFDLQLTQGSFRLDAQLASDARVIGLFGPSGAGKSTLLGILSGSIAPSRGRIVINGQCMLDTDKGINIPMHERRIGVVYQDGRLFPHLSVKNNLVYGLRLLDNKQRKLDFDEVVEMLEIGHLLRMKPRLLSGGERQRVALGRALLTSPELLLLDEPMASLDERLKTQILPFLRRIKEETSIPIVYVSHAIREVLELTQQLAVIRDGRILASGDYHEILTSEAVLPLAQSLGIENVIPVQLEQQNPDLGYSVGMFTGHRFILPMAEMANTQQVSVIIPASNISLALAPVVGTTIQNQVKGTVLSIKMVGHMALVTVDIGTSLLVEVTGKSIVDLGIHEGQEIYCLMKAQSIRYFGK